MMIAQKHELKFIELVRQGRYTVFENGDIYVTYCTACKSECFYKMRHYCGKDGYHSIRIGFNGKRCQIFVHRIVYTFFRGEIPDGLFINHIDGNPGNNAISNLEAVTPRENIQHAIHVTRTRRFYGAAHPNARLKPADVVKIIYYRNRGIYTSAQLAARFGVSVKHVRSIFRGRAWRRLFDNECILSGASENMKTGENWKGIIILCDQQPSPGEHP